MQNSKRERGKETLKEKSALVLSHCWSRKKMKRDRRISKMKERCRRMRERERRERERERERMKERERENERKREEGKREKSPLARP